MRQSKRAQSAIICPFPFTIDLRAMFAAALLLRVQLVVET